MSDLVRQVGNANAVCDGSWGSHMEESNDERKSRRAKSFENNYLLLFVSWRHHSNVTSVAWHWVVAE